MSSPLEGANLTAPVLDKTILERFPFLVEVVSRQQNALSFVCLCARLLAKLVPDLLDPK